MAHGLAAHGIEQRRGVGGIVRSGVDDGDLTLTDDVAHRAGKSEGARIVAENTPHAGSHRIDHAGLQRKIAIERDIVGVGHDDDLSGGALQVSRPVSMKRAYRSRASTRIAPRVAPTKMAFM